MYKPILTAIDLDKGCKRCYAENITILFPSPGVVGAPSGGDGFIPIRFQGYTDGSNTVWAEECWVSNVDIYQPYYAVNTPLNPTMGCLIGNYNALNCKAFDIRVHGSGVFRALFEAEADSNLVLTNISAPVKKLTNSLSPYATLRDCYIDLDSSGLTISTVYLYSSSVKLVITGGSYKFIGTGTVNFLQGYEQALGQPSIKIIGANIIGFNSAYNLTGATQLTGIRLVGNNSTQSAADVFSTVASTFYNGNSYTTV